jgi:hypothetical protein
MDTEYQPQCLYIECPLLEINIDNEEEEDCDDKDRGIIVIEIL